MDQVEVNKQVKELNILHNDFSNLDTDKWDKRMLGLAKHIASWSKDPSTQTGAVIADANRRIISVGYNGLPKGVKDLPERYNNRELKLSIIVHCERSAIIFAKRDLSNCILYTWPFMSCAACAGMVIQADITHCIAPSIPEDKKARWAKDMELASTLFDEAGVKLTILDLE